MRLCGQFSEFLVFSHISYSDFVIHGMTLTLNKVKKHFNTIFYLFCVCICVCVL